MNDARGPLAVIVVPDSNTTMEAELPLQWPGLGGIRRVGIPREPKPITAQELPAYRRKTLELVEPLADLRPDVVLYGCTTAGFLSGPEQDARLRDAIAAAVGAPTVTAALSMVAILRELKVQRPAVVTPYPESSNAGLERFMADMDLPVARLSSFLLTDIAQYDQVTHDQIRLLAADTARDGAADGVFIACTQLKTFGLLEPLQAELAMPVSGAIAATVWAGRRELGLPSSSTRSST